MSSGQLTDNGQLRHFLTIEGLKRPLLTEIMDRAERSSTCFLKTAPELAPPLNLQPNAYLQM